MANGLLANAHESHTDLLWAGSILILDNNHIYQSSPNAARYSVRLIKDN